MTQISAAKVNAYAVEQVDPRLSLAKAVAYAVEQVDPRLSLAKAVAYVVEQPREVLSAAKVVAYVVEQALPLTGLFTRYGGLWREVAPYVNMPGLRVTQSADQRVTEDGTARKIEPKDSGAAWVEPIETWVKQAGQWKRALPSK